MKENVRKMPITIILLWFSYLTALCGFVAGGLLIALKFRDKDGLILGLLVLAGGLVFAVLLRLAANVGQILFDTRIDIQNIFKQDNELGMDLREYLRSQTEAIKQGLLDISQLLNRLSIEEKKLKKELAQDIRNQLQIENQDLKDKLQAEGKDLKGQLRIESQDMRSCLQEQIEISKEELQVLIDKFDKSLRDEREIIQRLSEMKDNLDQMNGNFVQMDCDSKDMNQNISQIRDFFSQIEKHLDLNK